MRRRSFFTTGYLSVESPGNLQDGLFLFPGNVADLNVAADLTVPGNELAGWKPLYCGTVSLVAKA